MFEDHERAARIRNESGTTWHSFVRSRFVGAASGREGATSVAVDIQAAAQTSPSHAELRGLLEYGTASSLPVVFDLTGTLDLETREILLQAADGSNPELSYAGRLSENGRVLTLRLSPRGTAEQKPLNLIHEGTMRELFAD